MNMKGCVADEDRPRAGLELWSSDAWRAEAIAWLDAQLAGAGITRTGAVTQPHLRPWATALTAPTTAGPVWMKAAGPGTAFEIGLYALLAETAPAAVLVPIAADTGRAQIVLPDGGPALGERATGADLAAAMECALPEYAQLQRATASRIETALELGVADMRAPIMPQRFDEALGVVRAYVARAGTAHDEATVRRLARFAPTFRRWCEALAAVPVAPSLDHNDLHPWNILGGGDRGPARFFDWGDTVVAHPFSSLLVPLAWMQRELAADLHDPRLHRLRDAYLEGFGDQAPHAELVTTLELACRVGKTARALTWARALAAAGGSSEHADAPLRTLEALFDESYVGGA